MKSIEQVQTTCKILQHGPSGSTILWWMRWVVSQLADAAEGKGFGAIWSFGEWWCLLNSDATHTFGSQVCIQFIVMCNPYFLFISDNLVQNGISLVPIIYRLQDAISLAGKVPFRTILCQGSWSLSSKGPWLYWKLWDSYWFGQAIDSFQTDCWSRQGRVGSRTGHDCGVHPRVSWCQLGQYSCAVGVLLLSFGAGDIQWELDDVSWYLDGWMY